MRSTAPVGGCRSVLSLGHFEHAMKTSNSFFELWGVLELIGAVLFVAIGPFVWMYRLAAADRMGFLAGVATAWVISVAIICWELFRRRLSSVSLGVTIIWFVTLCFVFYAMA